MTREFALNLFITSHLQYHCGYVTMNDGVYELAAYVLQVLLKHECGTLFHAGDMIVFELDSFRIVLPRESIPKSIIRSVTQRYYSKMHPTKSKAILQIISSIIEQHMFPELINIDQEIKSLKKQCHSRRKTVKFKEDPPGKVHFRYTRGRQKYVLVSHFPANTVCSYEIPMIAKLTRCWPFGKILPNFCLLHETEHGWSRLFELDAITFNKSDLFIFELKHQQCANELELLKHFLAAAAKIQLWRKKIQNEVRLVVPFIYLRHHSAMCYTFLNQICYDELPRQFEPSHLGKFVAYPIENDLAELQIMEMMEQTHCQPG